MYCKEASVLNELHRLTSRSGVAVRRPNRREVIFETRPNGPITCPHCWTAQQSDRDFCYRCEAKFIFLDEVNRRK